MAETLNSGTVCTKLQRIAELAKEHPQWAFKTLAHVIDIELLREAYRRTRKDGAVGVDGQSAAEYERELDSNLRSLLDRFKSGSYRAPAVRRVYIPKADGSKERPIGIPSFEDKVLQRAVAMVLEAVYEQDFKDCSYGFRPGRSAHQALQAVWDGAMEMGGGWVVEVDIESFFDSLSHSHLRRILDRRVLDGVIRRVIHKWLKAGVLEAGQVSYPEAGTPQGGVISPLLANVYLHEVVDVWFAEQAKPRLKGRVQLIRYADDIAMLFEREDDARRVLEVLPKRFGKYGLRLHPDKTRLVRFERPGRGGGMNGEETPGTFDLLGFTHFWGKSRKGRWVVRRKTGSRRMTRALDKVRAWCRTHRHWPVAEQRKALAMKLRGHYAYFGITGNARALHRYLQAVRREWRKWLDRRSNRARMSWERFQRLLRHHPLPMPRVVHSVYAVRSEAVT